MVWFAMWNRGALRCGIGVAVSLNARNVRGWRNMVDGVMYASYV